MPLAALILKNLWSKKARSIGIAFAIGIAVMTVVTLTVVSSGLEASAAAVLTLGKADFTVAQNGVSEILYSNLDQSELRAVQSTPGVHSAVGVLLETEHLNAANPLFIEIGIPPDQQRQFGVTVVAGRSYTAAATHEMMLGWRAAQDFGLHVGDRFTANGTWNTVVGIYSTGISYGDLGGMFPLTALQTYNRVPGAVTLVFVKLEPGASVAKVEKTITTEHPEMTTIRTASQFGRADRNLVFLQAAVTGSTILAIVIGAVIVGNTMLLSLFERTREFGLLRAIGWTRSRGGPRRRRGSGAGADRRRASGSGSPSPPRACSNGCRSSTASCTPTTPRRPSGGGSTPASGWPSSGRSTRPSGPPTSNR